VNPPVVLINPVIVGVYIPPDDIEPTDLEDWELGGIGLSDPSQGLEVQSWHLQVLGTGTGTAVYVDAPNTPATLIFSYPNITWARLAFDQNMRPVISFVAASLPFFYWFDPLLPGNTVTALPTTVQFPCVTMDDKRPLSTTLNQNDVVMCYVNLGNLCYRLQRDRYGTEYVWYAGINTVVSNPFVNRIGMTFGLRLLIEVRGALYL
jgi:hypothetical protein